MRRYEDYIDASKNSDVSNVKWLKYKIIVPDEEEKAEFLEVCKHLHDSDIDTDFVGVNQLVHEYVNEDTVNIVVDRRLYNKLCIDKAEEVFKTLEAADLKVDTVYIPEECADKVIEDLKGLESKS
jgi:hypothetical protein